MKKPKRVLHFSDGTLEEYSTDEEHEETKTDSAALIDTVSQIRKWLNLSAELENKYEE